MPTQEFLKDEANLVIRIGPHARSKVSMNRRIASSPCAVLWLLAFALVADQPRPATAEASAIGKLSPEDQQALEVGRDVVAVRKAIKDFESPNSLKAIVHAGTITANYVWVRGWLNEELRTATHMLDIREGKARDKLARKVAFLKRAIRAIDLE